MSQRLLDEARCCAELVAWYRGRLPDVSGLTALHGAFCDLVPSSRDSKVKAATTERMTQCLDIAEELGIGTVIFHVDYSPLARDPDYFQHWVERQASFWRELLQGRSVTLLLENVWEPRPEVFRAAVDSVGADRVGACLDAAHVHLCSQQSQGQWVNALNSRIRCLHVSDNNRGFSEHLPPGQGTIDWKDLLGAMARHGLSVPAAMEVHGIAAAQATVDYLRALNVHEPPD